MANYIPLKLNNKLTTPHELVFGIQPDFQNILPMFSVAYVDYKDVHTLKIQTVKAILIGRSDISHALEFYHPHTKRVLTSAIFRLDETLTPDHPSDYHMMVDFTFINSSTHLHNTSPLHLSQKKKFVYIHHQVKFLVLSSRYLSKMTTYIQFNYQMDP